MDSKLMIDMDHSFDFLVDVAEDLLSKEESLYQKSGELINIIHGSDGYYLKTLRTSMVRYYLSQVSDFIKDEKSIHPPAAIARCILDKGQWKNIRPLRAITTFPPLHKDGNIITDKGYHNKSQVFFTGGIECQVPIHPTLEDAKEAIKHLYDIVYDFPFASSEHRSAFVAAVLTPLSRYAHDGNSPLILIQANAPRVGKTRLAKIISYIVCGEECPVVTHTQNPEEERKSMMSYLKAGRTMVLIDNIVGEYGGATVNALATSRTIEGRIVGSPKIMNVLNDTSWLLTGNNVVLAPDTAERCLNIRMICHDEKPHLRDNWKYPDIFKTVKDKRQQLLTAALTIIKAYIVAGMPKQQIPAWGSFESWSNLIRGSLVWMGEPDPAATRLELEAESDTGKQTFSTLLQGWLELQNALKEHKGLRAKEVYNFINCGAPAPTLLNAFSELSNNKGLPSPHIIGRWLRECKDRNYGGKIMKCHPDERNGHKWYVIELE